MKNNTLVTKKCRVSWGEREVLVGVVRVETWERGNGSVLAAQVTHLAGS